MRKIVSCLCLLLFVLAAPSFACNQICRYSGGGDSCDTVGWVTGMSCYMSGPVCIDVQEYGCWAPAAKDAGTPVALAEIFAPSAAEEEVMPAGLVP